jgi:hypothetical protein
MLKYCRDKWDKNKEKLETALREAENLNYCSYETLVEMVVEHILNPEAGYDDTYDKENITVIDNGDYQGTQLFMIPTKTYQPDESKYLLTFVSYGSCSGCDTLQSIQDWKEGKLTDSQVKDFMILCKDLVCNIIKPYNSGWRRDEKYEEIAE